MVSTNLVQILLNFKVVYFRLVRIYFYHIDHAFSIGPTGGSENLQTICTGWVTMDRFYFIYLFFFFGLLWHGLDLLHILRSIKNKKWQFPIYSPPPPATENCFFCWKQMHFLLISHYKMLLYLVSDLLCKGW